MATSATYGVAKYGDSLYGLVNVTATSGSYTLTGGSATFLYNKAVQGTKGTYTLTGSAATLKYARLFTASTGSYSQFGYSAGFIYNRDIIAGTWYYHLTGQSATLSDTRILTADNGSYRLTGADAGLIYTPLVTVIETKGGIPKRVKTRIPKNQRDEVEAAVRKAFDDMDGTSKVVKQIQKEVKQEIKQVDLTEYNIAMAQINALLLQAQLRISEYESEIDDEESLLMLL